MAHLVTMQKVEDFDKWQSVFDGAKDLRTEAGAVSEQVLQDAEDPKHVIVIVEFGSAEQAKAWADNPKLKERFAEAGVVDSNVVLTS